MINGYHCLITFNSNTVTALLRANWISNNTNTKSVQTCYNVVKILISYTLQTSLSKKKYLCKRQMVDIGSLALWFHDLMFLYMAVHNFI